MTETEKRDRKRITKALNIAWDGEWIPRIRDDLVDALVPVLTEVRKETYVQAIRDHWHFQGHAQWGCEQCDRYCEMAEGDDERVAIAPSEEE